MKRYIDADAFEKQIKETYCKDCDNPNGMRCLLCPTHDMLQKIYYAPTADVVEMRHGHWIEWWDDNYLSYCHKCSECGGYPLTKEETMHDEVLSAYCPHCGAKMDGGK